ncbi:acidic mammalian chitinase-like [Festucalex cinctus]
MHKIILLAGLCLTTAWLACAKKVVCVYDSVSDQRMGIGHFQINDIEPHLCTHLIYSSVNVDSNFQISLNANDGTKFPLIMELKKSDPHLKTILEVNLISDPLVQELIATPENRATFIKSAISILREPNYIFDGINILWQNNMDDFQKYIDYFTYLIEEFRKEFNKEAERRGSDELLLTVSVSAEPTVISQSYDVEEIADHIDFFNVMTSDIEMFVLNVQPSFSTPEESFAKAVSAVNFWNQTGVPSHKINMGIGVFGEAYTNDSQGMIQAEGGLLTDVPKGFLARYELCSFLDGPLEASSDKNVVFDDIASIDAKVQYIKKHHFGGAFVLSLDLDDFQQVCSTSDKKYPVIQHLHDELVEYY